jgi:hypothetical protein
MGARVAGIPVSRSAPAEPGGGRCSGVYQGGTLIVRFSPLAREGEGIGVRDTAMRDTVLGCGSTRHVRQFYSNWSFQRGHGIP